jgi:hypothetical protein
VTPSPESASMEPTLPRASVETRGGPSWSRLLPALALALALALLWKSWQSRGPALLLHTADGHGLAAGDRLQHRGIDVGRVEFVRLARRGEGIAVGVRLERSAADLACEGSRFWVVRPVVGLEGASGLETLFGGPYLAVDPGPPGGAERHDFAMLEEPPLFELEGAGALEVVLTAAERGGLARGAPLTYRDVQIGTVVSVGLARDASAVEARVLVGAEHVELVREDSRFWRRQGAQFSLGLTGARLEVPSLRSLWTGGLALATPTHPGRRAVNGQRFELAAEPAEAWLEWRPSLALGGALLPAGAPAPEPSWARLTWEERGWFGGERSVSGWLTALPGGGWVGPAELLLVPEDAEPDSARLQWAGHEELLSGAPTWHAGDVASRSLAGPPGAHGAGARRALAGPEDCLVFGDAARAPVALAGLEVGEGGEFSGALTLDERWHGAPVVARADGALVGLLIVRDGIATIASVPSE